MDFVYPFKMGAMPLYPTSKAKGRIKLVRDIVGASDTIEVLEKLNSAVAIYAARAIAIVVTDLLTRVQPRVPYDTGLLRVSGTATVKLGRSTEIVGVGKEDGTVTSWLGKITKSKLSGVRTIQGDVSYSRFNDSGKDIAIWTHEELQPFDRRPSSGGIAGIKYARFPGTGPKYLEIPWLENFSTYESFIKDELSGKEFEGNITLITKLRQKRTGRYEIKEFRDIILDQIKLEGYTWPGRKFTPGSQQHPYNILRVRLKKK